MGRSGTTVLAEAISTHKDLGWISKYLEIFFITSINIFYLRGKKKTK
ncbi:MAG: hypothetical protein MW689_001550 [Thermodesulfobacteria bacterium]|nr:hypothetical protein [Thermodesulfobacteriota bacterium]